LTNDGKPYGPWRYKEIVKECYFITKNTSTTYSDILQMTPTERGYILEFLQEEFKKQQEQLEKIKAEHNKY
jgi:hypothetical protein